MNRVRAKRITAENFADFGSVARIPSTTPLAETAQFRYWSDSAHFGIEGETEIGYCTVFPSEAGVVNWMERHERTPEVLIPIDRAVVLPVLRDGEVLAFLFEPGEAVVIGQNVWHSACLPAEGPEANYFVIFRRGTPHEDVIKQDLQKPVRIEP